MRDVPSAPRRRPAAVRPGSRGRPPPTVLLRLRALEEERVGRSRISDGPVTHATRHNEQISGGEVNGALPLQLDAKSTRPTKEELILLVRVPRKLALAAHH